MVLCGCARDKDSTWRDAAAPRHQICLFLLGDKPDGAGSAEARTSATLFTSWLVYFPLQMDTGFWPLYTPRKGQTTTPRRPSRFSVSGDRTGTINGRNSTCSARTQHPIVSSIVLQ